MIDWTQRIEQHLRPDRSVVVPPRIARWLERKAGVTGDKRMLLRDTDPEAYGVLAALHVAAMADGAPAPTRSALGTKGAEQQPDTETLETWMTTSEAAASVGVTPRAIVGWISKGKLPATRVGRSWMVASRHMHIAQALAGA